MENENVHAMPEPEFLPTYLKDEQTTPNHVSNPNITLVGNRPSAYTTNF
jgi:hypothetical protein